MSGLEVCSHLAVERGHGLDAVCDPVDLWIYGSQAWWGRRRVVSVILNPGQQDVGQRGLSSWMDH